MKLHPAAPVHLLCVVTALLAGAATARADLAIDVGTILLLPNKPDQSFDLYLSNNGAAVQLQGLLLEMQVADGGPAAGGAINGPAITAADVFAGAQFLFHLHDTGPSGLGSIVPQVFERGTLTGSGVVTVPAGTLITPTLVKLATVTVDTTSYQSGLFVFSMANTLNGPSELFFPTGGGADFAFVDGALSITPVPEPAEVAVAMAGLLLGFAALRRLRK